LSGLSWDRQVMMVVDFAAAEGRRCKISPPALLRQGVRAQ